MCVELGRKITNRKIRGKKCFKKIWEKKCWVKKIGKNFGKEYCETITLMKMYNEINQLKLSHLSHHIGMYKGNLYTFPLIFISSVTIFSQR